MSVYQTLQFVQNEGFDIVVNGLGAERQYQRNFSNVFTFNDVQERMDTFDQPQLSHDICLLQMFVQTVENLIAHLKADCNGHGLVSPADT
jgi:hypothetical protein